MISSKDFDTPGFAPWDGMLAAYCEAVDTGFGQTDTLFKTLAQCQLELWGLTSRRLQACLALPGTLSRCKTSLDAVHAQAKFYETALLQGAESARRMADCVNAAAGLGGPIAEQWRERPVRDFITLTVAKPPRAVRRRPSARETDQRRVA